jgi:hypothetical protein
VWDLKKLNTPPPPPKQKKKRKKRKRQEQRREDQPTDVTPNYWGLAGEKKQAKVQQISKESLTRSQNPQQSKITITFIVLTMHNTVGPKSNI